MVLNRMHGEGERSVNPGSPGKLAIKAGLFGPSSAGANHKQNSDTLTHNCFTGLPGLPGWSSAVSKETIGGGCF